jgi:hypothetical protein
VPEHLRKRKGEIISTKPCLPKAVIRYKKKTSRFPHHGPREAPKIFFEKVQNPLDHLRELATAAVRHHHTATEKAIVGHHHSSTRKAIIGHHHLATEKAIVGVLLDCRPGERAHSSKENNDSRQRIRLANREK